jgi:hypothetical protein
MNDALLVEWVALGERLREAAPEKFADVMQRLEAILEAQETISTFPRRLFAHAWPRWRINARSN